MNIKIYFFEKRRYTISIRFKQMENVQELHFGFEQCDLLKIFAKPMYRK